MNKQTAVPGTTPDPTVNLEQLREWVGKLGRGADLFLVRLKGQHPLTADPTIQNKLRFSMSEMEKVTASLRKILRELS